MSSYGVEARNPKTGEFEQAIMLDNYFGIHRYGVKFGDGEVYKEDEIEIKNMKCQDEMHNHNINNEGYCAMCSEEEYPLSTFSQETQKELIAWKDEEVRKITNNLNAYIDWADGGEEQLCKRIKEYGDKRYEQGREDSELDRLSTTC